MYRREDAVLCGRGKYAKQEKLQNSVIRKNRLAKWEEAVCIVEESGI